jgi:hypothetical protein
MAAQTTLILHHRYRYEQREPKEVRDAAQITGMSTSSKLVAV